MVLNLTSYSTFTVLSASSWSVGTTNRDRGPTAGTLSLAGPTGPIVDAITISVVFTLWVHAHDRFALVLILQPETTNFQGSTASGYPELSQLAQLAEVSCRWLDPEYLEH